MAAKVSYYDIKSLVEIFKVYGIMSVLFCVT